MTRDLILEGLKISIRINTDAAVFERNLGDNIQEIPIDWKAADLDVNKGDIVRPLLNLKKVGLGKCRSSSTELAT